LIVEGGELFPFGDDEDCIGGEHLCCFGAVFYGGVEFFEVLHRLRVVCFDVCLVSEEFLYDGDGTAFSDVIGVWFEGKAKDANGFSFQVWDVFLKDFDESEWLVVVDCFDAFDNPYWFLDFVCPGDECVNVLGETGASPADAGVKEWSADSGIQTHAGGDLVGVDVKFLT